MYKFWLVLLFIFSWKSPTHVANILVTLSNAQQQINLSSIKLFFSYLIKINKYKVLKFPNQTHTNQCNQGILRIFKYLHCGLKIKSTQIYKFSYRKYKRNNSSAMSPHETYKWNLRQNDTSLFQDEVIVAMPTAVSLATTQFAPCPTGGT